MASPQTVSVRDKTRQQIILAAEKLFAEKGFRAMTLRAVTREAQVNLAAVNYHFGSKSQLMLEVIRNRMAPINQERLLRLHALVSQHAPNPIPVEAIFESLFRPLFESNGPGTRPDAGLMLLLGRAFSEPTDFMRDMHNDFFQALTRQYLTELKRSCPQMPIDTLRYRFFLTIGTMLGTLIDQMILETLTASKSKQRNYDKILNELIAYTSAGFQHA